MLPLQFCQMTAFIGNYEQYTQAFDIACEMIKRLHRYRLKKILLNSCYFYDVVKPCDRLLYKSTNFDFYGHRRILNYSSQLKLACTVAKSLIGYELANKELQEPGITTCSILGVQITNLTIKFDPCVQKNSYTHMSEPGVQETSATEIADQGVQVPSTTEMADPDVQKNSTTEMADSGVQETSATKMADPDVQKTSATEMAVPGVQKNSTTEMADPVVQDACTIEMFGNILQETDFTPLSYTVVQETDVQEMSDIGSQDIDFTKMADTGSRESDITPLCSGICDKDKETVSEDMDISVANDTATVLVYPQETTNSKHNDYDLSDLFSGELEQRRIEEAKKSVMKNKRFKRSHKNSDSKDNDNEQGAPSEKKKRPNYFIALQLNNAKIKSALQNIQDTMVSREKRLASAVTSVRKLHITLMVMCLESDEDIQKSKLALYNAAQKLVPIHSVSPLTLSMSGLGDFKGQVVFAKVKEDNQLTPLTNIAEVVEESFLDQQIVSTDKRGFKPHVTIMKMSKMRAWQKKGLKKIDNALYEEFEKCDFGSDTVNTLQLCSMEKPVDKHGYYHVEHSALFDRVGIPQEKKYVIPALRPRKETSGD